MKAFNKYQSKQMKSIKKVVCQNAKSVSKFKNRVSEILKKVRLKATFLRGLCQVCQKLP